VTRASYINDWNQLKNILGWILDSGATQNFVNDKTSLKDYRRFGEPGKVYLGDNTTIYAEGLGVQRLQTRPYILELLSWFVPGLAENLILTRLLDQAGYSILIENNIVQIRQRNSIDSPMPSMVIFTVSILLTRNSLILRVLFTLENTQPFTCSITA
jgi:hypothetical protein